MTLEDIIYKRKSCRHFKDEQLPEDTLNDIEDFISNIQPLIDIKTKHKIVGRDKVKTVLRWSAPHYLAIFSKKSENYLLNVGFIYQQVDLYLQSLGLGSCWIGLASYTGEKIEGYEFIIFIGFGKTENNIHRELNEFNRKNLDEISDETDEKLKPAQYAPSAINAQPWYFKHNTDSIDVYCKKPNIIKKRFISNLPYIDIGIALAHLYIANKDKFEFFIKENPIKISKHDYMGSIII